MLENATKIRAIQNPSFNTNDVISLPDMAKLERDDDTKLRPRKNDCLVPVT